jgi:hypothetical protein
MNPVSEVYIVEIYHEQTVGNKDTAVWIPMIVAATEQIAHEKWAASKYNKYKKRFTKFVREQ